MVGLWGSSATSVDISFRSAVKGYCLTIRSVSARMLSTRYPMDSTSRTHAPSVLEPLTTALPLACHVTLTVELTDRWSLMMSAISRSPMMAVLGDCPGVE